jgi:ketosteroid isomerase-like protein
MTRASEAQVAEPAERSTAEVLDDHLECRMKGDVEADIARNYSPDVVVLTAAGPATGHDAVRHFNDLLRRTVPKEYEIPLKLVEGRFAFIEWRARAPGTSVEDGADSFVVENGRIVFQSIHYSLQTTMPT